MGTEDFGVTDYSHCPALNLPEPGLLRRSCATHVLVRSIPVLQERACSGSKQAACRDGGNGEVAGPCWVGGTWECHQARPAVVRPSLPEEPENPALAP